MSLTDIGTALGNLVVGWLVVALVVLAVVALVALWISTR